MQTPNQLFRWKDFGSYTYAGSRKLFLATNKSFFVPRSSDGDFASSKPGVDFLEHSPASFLHDAQVVVLLGGHNEKPLTNQYFTLTSKDNKIRHSWSFYNTAVLRRSNVKGEQIVREIRKIKTLVSRPSSRNQKEFAPLSLFQRPLLELAKSLIPQGWQYLTKQPSPSDERYVTLILTTDNPNARSSFSDFRNKLGLAKYVC